jgi:hypothetical protein
MTLITPEFGFGVLRTATELPTSWPAAGKTVSTRARVEGDLEVVVVVPVVVVPVVVEPAMARDGSMTAAANPATANRTTALRTGRLTTLLRRQ